MKKPKILSDLEINTRLQSLKGWKYADHKIQKEFAFKDFMDSLDFVAGLASFFEAHDHHPDIHILYSKVLFELQRFDVGGKVTDRDFLTAHKIEAAYTQRNPALPV